LKSETAFGEGGRSGTSPVGEYASKAIPEAYGVREDLNFSPFAHI
jgi:hypothetical protein